MLTVVSDAIVAALGSIPDVRHVGEWAGQVEDLLKTAQPTPSLHVIYSGCRYDAAPAAMGTRLADYQMIWTVLAMSKNHRSRRDGALAAYELVEQARDKLINLPTAAGRLWPQREGLILAQGGLLVFGLDYGLAARFAQ